MEQPRRRRRIDPLLDDAEEIVKAAIEGREPIIGYPSDDEPQNKYDFNPDETIWREYGISPNLTVKLKIERLLTAWRLDSYEIAKIVRKDVDEVEQIIKNLEAEWADLGRMPGPEQRDMSRGRMIADLFRTINGLDAAMVGASTADMARLLGLKMNALNQITSLQGLAPSKSEPLPGAAVETDPTQEIIDALPDSEQDALFAALRTALKTPSPEGLPMALPDSESVDFEQSA